MDLISKQVIEVSSLALDGLAARHKALSANIANEDTPGYQRTDVNFEGQLSKIVASENNNQQQKEAYSAGLAYSPTSVPTGSGTSNLNKLLSIANGTYDPSNPNASSYAGFNPEVMNTNDAPVKTNGNNVNIEYEMAELAKNGTKYAAISSFEEKQFKELTDVIKGATA